MAEFSGDQTLCVVHVDAHGEAWGVFGLYSMSFVSSDSIAGFWMFTV